MMVSNEAQTRWMRFVESTFRLSVIVRLIVDLNGNNEGQLDHSLSAKALVMT